MCPTNACERTENQSRLRETRLVLKLHYTDSKKGFINVRNLIWLFLEMNWVRAWDMGGTIMFCISLERLKISNVKLSAIEHRTMPTFLKPTLHNTHIIYGLDGLWTIF